MMPKVFISYAHADKSQVTRVEQTLLSLGADFWKDDYKLVPGDDVQQTISRVIANDVDIVIVILTALADASPWVKWEKDLAGGAIASGHHIELIYVKVDKFDVPPEIAKRMYVDFCLPPGSDEAAQLRQQLKATGEIARLLLCHRPWRRLGVFDVYYCYNDMDTRRQIADGRVGCDIHAFVESAKHRVVAVGYNFGCLFGPNHGVSLGKWLKAGNESDPRWIDIYVPHPTEAPLDNLCYVYSYGAKIPKSIKDFVDTFRAWGRDIVKLSESEADRVTLHFVKPCITHSLLAIDPDQPHGRMIADIPSPGDCDRQLKVEFRFPKTPLYERYWQALAWLDKNECNTDEYHKMITSHC